MARLARPVRLAAAVLCLAGGSAQAQLGVDAALPAYERVSGISGNLTSIGSDTLNNLMTLWAEGFQGLYPIVNIQIQGAGTSTAPPALTENTANFGPMSRAMRAGEIRAFDDRFGYPPTQVRVALDVLAVYVHRDNPVKGLTIPEIDAIFSTTRRCGHRTDITRWGQVGLGGGWANRDFTLYSRNAASGTNGYFRQHALCDGDFKASINEQPGSGSVVQGVGATRGGIGYSGIGYITAGVRAVPLARDDDEPFVPPDAAHAVDGSYPFARFLYVYVNHHPVRGLPPLEREFLRFVLSRQGQEIVVRDGYIPLPAALAADIRERLGLE